MNIRAIFSFALFCAVATNAQQQLSDDVIRRLGGDPDALRERAAREAKEAPSPEQLAINKRAQELLPNITDEVISSIKNNDPLLLALYAEHIGSGGGPFPDASVIGRDIKRRTDAKVVVEVVFRTQPIINNRCGVLRWLGSNKDVKWGADLMDEAIASYREDPKKWNSTEAFRLRYLIAVHGNESHLAFFDELDKAGVEPGEYRTYFEERLKTEKAPKPSEAQVTKPIEPPPPRDKPSQPTLLQQKEHREKEGTTKNVWLTGALIVITAAVLVLRVLKNRK